MQDGPTDPAGGRGHPTVVDRLRRLPQDWRWVLVGAAAAPGLVLVGFVIGSLEGGLLPWACQGLACLFAGLVLGYAGLLAVVWGLLALVVRWTRRRQSASRLRTWVLRVLGVLSWVVALLPVVIALS